MGEAEGEVKPVAARPIRLLETVEWLEPDGLGGFASGTVEGPRTRRYHALLLTATAPPAGRFVLVNGFEAWVDTPRGRFPLSTQRYLPDVLYPDGESRLRSFDDEPWPTWNWRFEGEFDVTLELFVPRDVSACVLNWRFGKPGGATRLLLRPLLSGRDFHGTHRENPAFRSEPRLDEQGVTWKPYEGVPAVSAVTNGVYRQDPEWFRNFLYLRERDRGLDCVEDLASPGTFSWEGDAEAVMILAAEGHVAGLQKLGTTAAEIAAKLRESERKRRAAFPTRLHRSADAFIVRRESGKTIIAGYPWFGDWGRDTFIGLRGLCLATGRLDEAREILTAWADTISEGMLPNRFPESGTTPEYNSVDASLWYIIAVHDYLAATASAGRPASPQDKSALAGAVRKILAGYARGTRFGIHGDADGLLAAGVPGVQLTWMDAKVGDWVVTPRIGKPVEVQALWLCALRIGSEFEPTWRDVYDRGLASFRARFWNASRGCLYDVVDVDHKPGTVDDALRPNQLFAVGGLPWMLLDASTALQVVDLVESRLWTPMGPRSLEPGAAGYRGTYAGGVRERDGAYHQGTVWPWLIGPFVEAWVRARGDTAAARIEAASRFVMPLLDHLDQAGLGHISEIADGDAPHTPRGCPFQAWSLGELLRLTERILKPRDR